MYQIYADATLIYDSTLEDYRIGKGQITKETDKAGSFVFSLYPDHPYYDKFVQLKTVITVYKDGRIVFRGRVLNESADYWNNKVLTCEGELSFLQDSIVRPYAFTGTPAELFRKFVSDHNAQVDEFKRFKVGTVTVVDPNGYIARDNTAYESALANMTGRLLEDSTGGHLYITHGDDGRDPVPTLHYLADFPKTASQAIEFGANLKNYTKKVGAENVATAIIPLGAKVDDGNSDTEDPRLTIASVNGGKDYVYDSAAVALRGWIVKVVEWDDVTEASILKAKALEYLAAAVNQTTTVELNAVDLHLLDRSIESFNVSEYVRVYSQPHSFAAVLLCNKQTMDLLKPENDSLVLGHTFSTFTESSTKALARVTRRETSAAGAITQQLVDIINRLEVLEGLSITIVVEDNLGDVAGLLTASGALTVAGQTITESPAGLTVHSRSAAITYTLKSSLVSPRKVSLNGLELGTVTAAGDKVTTTVEVAAGSEIVVAFYGDETQTTEGG